MVFLTVKLLLGALIITHWTISIEIPKVIYQEGREYYDQGLAEYRKTAEERNLTLAFNLLREACERTDYTIPTFVNDYAFTLRTAKVKVEADLVVSILERGIAAQLELLERVTSTNTTLSNYLVFDHKHEILLYAAHLINYYDAIHEHMGLGWEELGFVVRCFLLLMMCVIF